MLSGVKQDERGINYEMVEQEVWNHQIDSYGNPRKVWVRKDLPSVEGRVEGNSQPASQGADYGAQESEAITFFVGDVQ